MLLDRRLRLNTGKNPKLQSRFNCCTFRRVELRTKTGLLREALDAILCEIETQSKTSRRRGLIINGKQQNRTNMIATSSSMMKLATSFLLMTTILLLPKASHSFLVASSNSGAASTTSRQALKAPPSMEELLKPDGTTGRLYDEHVQKTYG